MQTPTRLLRIANLTLVDQSPHLGRYGCQGFAVDAAPAGITIVAGSPATKVRRLAEAAAHRVAQQGYDGAILGGRPDVVCYLHDALQRAGVCSYVADTARMLDREGYFVAIPIGLVAVAPTGSLRKDGATAVARADAERRSDSAWR